MKGTVSQLMTATRDATQRKALQTILAAIADRMSSQATTSAALEIAAGGSTVAQVGASATFHGVANGKAVTIAAGTDMPALTGLVITANSFNVACFYIDAGSTVTAVFGIEGTTRAKLQFPAPPLKKALVGYLVITHSATFTGGTTALDTATTQYISPVGAFDATILV